MQKFNMENIIYGGVCFLLFVLFIWFIVRFFRVLGRGTIALWKAHKQNQIERELEQLKFKRMGTHELRQALLNDSYFSGLKDTKVLSTIVETIKSGREKTLVPRLSQSKMYYLLVEAEHELGRRGQPEAVDSIITIWDMLKELGSR